MAVPKRRKSHSRKNMRKAQHLKLAAPALSTCPQCREPKPPHRVCIRCGYYKGQEIIRMDEDKKKK